MSYNTSPTLDKQTCTDYVDFGKCQDKFGQVSWTKNDSNCLHIKPEVFKRPSKDAKFRLRQNFTMGEAGFNQFNRQSNQLFVAADNFLRERNTSPILQSTPSKNMEK